MQRVDKVLSHALSVSRSEIKSMIKHKRVTCNQIIVDDGGLKVSAQDVICVDLLLVNCFPAEVIMINKPKGVVCSTHDPHHPTVFQVFNLSSKQYHMVGRLDQDTTGLLLLTTNGQLTHHIMHPLKKIEKHYIVTLDSPISDAAIHALAQGVDIQDDTICAPAFAQRLSACVIVLRLSEGRYHQVKRMMLALGYHVLALHRSQIGDLTLGDLLECESRVLSDAEVGRLKEKHISTP